MSAQDSNLKSVGYDMVVGLTQNSINKTMKNYLLNINTPPITMIYVYNDISCTSTRVLSPEETTAFVQEADPFSIPDGTNSSDHYGNEQAIATGNILYDKLFAYGFKATMGLPIAAGTPPYEISGVVTELPNIIKLDSNYNDQIVNYDMYFKSFQIVKQDFYRGYWEMKSYEQEDINPLIFNSFTNLDLSKTNQSFNELNPEQQAVFKNLDPNTMFSVSQLMLDLSSDQMIKPPTIDMDRNNPYYYLINMCAEDIAAAYWDSLKLTGGVAFSSTVVPINTDLPESIIVPSDLNFIVKPYTSQGETLTNEEREDLSTLNYLIMDSGNSLPNPIRNISWDWLNKQEDVDNDGIMAVSREIFVAYLNNVLSPCLNMIFLDPIPRISGPDKGVLNYSDDHNDDSHYSVTYNQLSRDFSFTEVSENAEGKVLTANFTSPTNTNKDDDFGEMTTYNTGSSDIYLKDNQIICECFVATHLDLDIVQDLHLGHANIAGWVYATKLTTTYDIDINGDGVIHLTVVDSNKEDLIDNGYSSGQLHDTSTWDEMAAGNEFDDCMDQICTDCTLVLDNAMDSYASNIIELLNDITQFVFPGATTFAFENCKFSDHQDFLTTITYAATN